MAQSLLRVRKHAQCRFGATKIEAAHASDTKPQLHRRQPLRRRRQQRFDRPRIVAIERSRQTSKPPMQTGRRGSVHTRRSESGAFSHRWQQCKTQLHQ
jgi:hypothetical protein